MVLGCGGSGSDTHPSAAWSSSSPLQPYRVPIEGPAAAEAIGPLPIGATEQASFGSAFWRAAEVGRVDPQQSATHAQGTERPTLDLSVDRVAETFASRAASAGVSKTVPSRVGACVLMPRGSRDGCHKKCPLSAPGGGRRAAVALQPVPLAQLSGAVPQAVDSALGCGIWLRHAPALRCSTSARPPPALRDRPPRRSSSRSARFGRRPPPRSRAGRSPRRRCRALLRVARPPPGP